MIELLFFVSVSVAFAAGFVSHPWIRRIDKERETG
jgi:hypothetical protein